MRTFEFSGVVDIGEPTTRDELRLRVNPRVELKVKVSKDSD